MYVRHSMYKHHHSRCGLLERRRHVQRRGPRNPGVAHVDDRREAGGLWHLDEAVRDALVQSPHGVAKNNCGRGLDLVPLREVGDVRQVA